MFPQLLPAVIERTLKQLEERGTQFLSEKGCVTVELHFKPMSRDRKRGRNSRKEKSTINDGVVPPVQGGDSPEKKRRRSTEIVLGNPIVILLDEDMPNVDLSDMLYSKEIYSHLLQQENKTRTSPRCLRKQTEITSTMRKIMVDWLVQVHDTFELLPETLYLTINLMDRFLTVRDVASDTYQLVAMASMLIASKFEDVSPVQIEDFIFLTKNGFSREQLKKMEYIILTTLKFCIGSPSSYHFVRLYSQFITSSQKTQMLSHFLIETTLMDLSLAEYTPSEIAAGALYLSRLTMGETPWTPLLERFTGYGTELARICAFDVNNHAKRLRQSTTLKAIVNKYTTDTLGQVALVKIVEEI